MTQEEKQLLLNDFCARLSYGVIYHRKDGANIELFEVDIKNGNLNYTDNVVMRECKPYLRPMSSMTEEEKGEASKLGVCDDGAFHNDIYDVGIGMEEAFAAISWLLERHFDINYLIHKGLALEAPEGMYKIE